MNSVGIIDAELLADGKHRFPNLAAMKLSAWHKGRGDTVSLLPDYRHAGNFDWVYLCCVFTEVAKGIPPKVLKRPNVQFGGTGFFFDKAPPLPKAVEHSPPDYDLYRDWLQGRTGPSLRYYTDYAIGYLTRGCFRRCKFCINRNCRKAIQASPLREFYTPQKKRVCLLDDNILAYKDCETLLANLSKTCERDGKTFEFKQGLDIRLLTPTIASLLAKAPFGGEVIFAFDQMKDAATVKKGLAVLRKRLPTKSAKGYILCGFESQGWRDIASVFYRLQVLWKAGVIGYVMRHQNHRLASPVCRTIYTHVARWANQPQFQRKLSFREFCEKSGGRAARAMTTFEQVYPDVAKEYFDRKYGDS